MPNLIAYEFLSLDGRFEGPEGHEMAFVKDLFTPSMENDIASQYETINAFVMGRTTFEKLAQYWPTEAARNEPLVDYMNDLPKLVVSSRGDVSAWRNSEHVAGDPVSALAERKRTGSGDMMIIGSASVVQRLTAESVIDEYRFLIFPVIVGKGRALFDTNADAVSLKLVREHVFENGVLALNYQAERS